MIESLLLKPNLLHQTADEEHGMPEPAIAVCVDAGGLVVLSQEGRSIIVNRASVNELCKLLKKQGA